MPGTLTIMESCLDTLFARLFGRRPALATYRKIASTDEIELVEHRYVVRDIYYRTNEYTVNLSNIIMFKIDGIRINGAFIRYEYIPVINKIATDIVVLPTFTNLIDDKITKADCVSNIYIRFECPTECTTFSTNLLSKMINVKENREYDKSIFKFAVAKKFMS